MQKPRYTDYWKIFILPIILFFTLSTSFGQKTIMKFDHITRKDGLSQSTVYAVLQDSKGFMWFATLDGLNKYDGYRITKYRNKFDDSTSIPDNQITALYEDTVNHSSTLWIGTGTGGFSCYDRIKERFINYRHQIKNKNSISSGSVNSIIKDGLGNFWVATNEGLNKFDGKKSFEHFGTANGLVSNVIRRIAVDEFNNLWLATDNGVNKYEYKTKRVTLFQNANGNSDNNYINDICLDNSGNVWLATNYGLNKLDTATGKFKTYLKDPKNNFSLSGNKINCLYFDRAGFLWIGTEKGGLNKFEQYNEVFYVYKNESSDPQSISGNNVLSIFQDNSGIFWVGTNLGGVNKWNKSFENLEVYRHNPYDAYSLSSNQVRCVYQDKAGDLWIGTVDAGLNKWDKKNNKFIQYQYDYSNPNSLSHNHIRSMLEDSKGNFWIGTDGGGLNKFDRKTGEFAIFKHINGDKNSISNDRVWKIYEDQKGVLWVATYGGGLNRFDPIKGNFISFQYQNGVGFSLSNNQVTSILQDSLGNLWVGTYGGGLNKWDPESEAFIPYMYDAKVSNSLGNNRVYCLHLDRDGELWVGTKGSLNRFDRNSETFERYTEAEGLPNDVILGILEDADANLWISTNNGLFRFNKKTNEIRSYDMRDGLQSDEFLAGSYFKTSDGMMLFGGINGFNTFYPKTMKDNNNIPQIVITGFQIYNVEAQLDTAISEKHYIFLNYSDKVLSFDFVALDYNLPEKNQYAYMMEGIDSKWNNVGNRRYANYTNLPPDRYVFRVKGSNNDQKWNEEGTSIVVIIKPAWWQTIELKFTIIILVIAGIYIGVKVRIKRIEIQKRHLEELVRLRTAEVVSQKEEIEAQRDEIEAQRDNMKAQRDHISLQKQEILDSIVYARRIQTAILPSDQYMKDIVSEYFILFKPKDIVSGDFYWVSKKNDILVIVAADCTGHGVPGAFMSMFGVSFLNKIVNEKGIVYPTTILNRLRANIIRALKQKGLENQTRDGMDTSLVSLDLKNKKLRFAGANNPLYLVHNKELTVLKGDKMPVGIYDNMEKFTTHEVDIVDNDRFYLFSDGYADQFGGDRGKKFKYNQFRDLIVEISDKPMSEQKEILDRTIEDWKGEHEQVDDILVMGFRV